MKEKFFEWLQKQKMSNGQPYKESTIKAYAHSISNGLPDLALKEQLTDKNLYDINSVKEFEKVKESLEKNDSFKQSNFNNHNLWSNALKRYLEFLKSIESTNNIYPDDVDEQEKFPDDAVKQVLINRYERDPENRRKCIEHYTTKPKRPITCIICDFDFESIYGEHGRDFIHIHHKTPLHEIKNDNNINPVEDLIPVCCNCHAMLHRKRDQLMKPEQLRDIINIQKESH